MVSSRLVILGFWVWKSGLFTKVPTAAFSYNVLDPVKGDVIAEAVECYLPCKVLLNNKSKDAEKIIWELKDTIIEDVDEPVHVYLKPDMYNMTLTASACKKSSIYSRQLKVKALPFASFEVVNNGCTGPWEVNFKNASVNATNFSWSFPGATGQGTSNKENPGSRRYINQNKYTVTLKVENEDGITSESSKEITILKDNSPFCRFHIPKNDQGISGETNVSVFKPIAKCH